MDRRRNGWVNAVLAGSLMVLVLAACAGAQAAAADSAAGDGETGVTDYASLVDALGAQGLTVEPGEDVEQPFMPVIGQTLTVNGELVQVFTFESDQQAEEFAATLPADGTGFATVMVTWMDTPHFYHSGKLIVLHVGSSEEVTASLVALLGPQVAGG